MQLPTKLHRYKLNSNKNMKKFYKITIGDSERYYTNLSKLCEQEQLIYSNAYHSITRQKKGVWSDDTCTVEMLYFSGV